MGEVLCFLFIRLSAYKMEPIPHPGQIACPSGPNEQIKFWNESKQGQDHGMDRFFSCKKKKNFLYKLVTKRTILTGDKYNKFNLFSNMLVFSLRHAGEKSMSIWVFFSVMSSSQKTGASRTRSSTFVLGVWPIFYDKPRFSAFHQTQPHQQHHFSLGGSNINPRDPSVSWS